MLKNKNRRKRGETFAEILIAILVAAFGSMIVAVMYTAAMNMNLKASEMDDEYYEALSDMETIFNNDKKKEKDGKAYVTDKDGNQLDISIDEYGNGTNSAYKRR